MDEGTKRMIAIVALTCVRSVFKSGENSLIYKTGPHINQNIILELLEFRKQAINADVQCVIKLIKKKFLNANSD